MSPDKLIELARSQGVQLWTSDNKLHFRSSNGKLPDDIRNSLRASRDEIIAYLERKKAEEKQAPLTANQKRLLTLELLDPHQSAHNMAIAFRSLTPLPLARLQEAVDRITERHEVLRSRIQQNPGETVQKVLPVTDGAAFPEIELVENAKAGILESGSLLADAARERFDPENASPVRIRLFRRDGEDLLLFVFNHLFFDGRSYGIFLAELNALLNGGQLPQADLDLYQFPDHAALQPASAADDETYWCSLLKEAPPLNGLPADRPRSGHDFRGDHLELNLSDAETAQLRSLSASLETSLFAMLASLFAVFLCRWTGREDVVLGAPFDSRPLAHADKAMGFYASLLPLRFRPGDARNLGELVALARQQIDRGLGHAGASMPDVLRRLELAGRADTSPLIQTTFSLDGADDRALAIDGLPMERIIVDRGNVTTELEVSVREIADGLAFRFTYARALFERDTVLSAARAFLKMLRGSGLSASTRLEDVVPEPASVHDVAAPVTDAGTLLEIIAARSADIPGQIVFQSGERSVTLSDLVCASDIAAELLWGPATPPDRILIRSNGQADPDHLVAMLTAWRTGIPVAVEPASATDAVSGTFLGSSHGEAPVNFADYLDRGADAVSVQAAAGRLAEAAQRLSPDCPAMLWPNQERLAPLRHGRLASMAAGLSSLAELAAGDRIAAFLPISQPATLWQIALALTTGAVLTGPRETDENLPLTARLAADPGADVYFLPGSLADAALRTGWRPEPNTLLFFDRSLPDASLMAVLRDPGLNCTAVLAAGNDGQGCYLLAGAVPMSSSLSPVLSPVGEVRPAGPSEPGRHNTTGGAVLRLRPDGDEGTDAYHLIARACGSGYRLLSNEEACLVARPDPRDIEQLCKRISGEDIRVRLELLDGRLQLTAEATRTTADTVLLATDLAAVLPPHHAPQFRHMTVADDAQGREYGLVSRAWAEVLGAPPAQPLQSFFSAGGHSLAAVRLAKLLSDLSGLAIAPADVMAAPTPAGLAARLFERAGQPAADAPPETDVTVDETAATVGPLSPQQRRLWTADRLGLTGALQAIPMRYLLTGALDRAAFARAVDRLVDRHAVLRTRFVEREGQPCQVIQPAPSGLLSQLDLSRYDEATAGRQRASFEAAILDAPFDLGTASLFRIGLLTTAPDRHELLINVHHIVMDAWSLEIVFKDLKALYEAELQRRPADLPECPARYLDYAIRRTGDVRASSRRNAAYWESRLQGAPQHHGLTALPAAAGASYRAAHLREVCATAASVRFSNLVEGLNATPFVVMSTLLASALCKRSGARDIVLGTPVANRTDADLWPVVGLFVETMPMRFTFNIGDDLETRIVQARRALEDDRQHDDLPFAAIVRAAGADNDLTRNPLFQITIVEHTTGLQSLSMGAAEATLVKEQSPEARFDLTLNFRRLHDGRLTLDWVYDEALFTAGDVKALHETLMAILQGTTGIAGAETAAPIAAALTNAAPLLAAFDAHALANPDAPACRTNDASVTYGALHARSWALADRIVKTGAERGKPVGLLCQRTPDFVAAMLAILRTGAPYVPLEAEHPTARLREILADCGAGLLVTDQLSLQHREKTEAEGHPDLLPPGCRVLLVSETVDGASPLRFPGATLEGSRATQYPLAYVLYTSGTTGKPKGVLVPQRGVLNYLLAQRGFLELDAAEAQGDFLCLTSFAFDTCVASLWGALVHGRCVYLASEDERYDPEFVESCLARPENFALAYVPPALLSELTFEPSAKLIPRVVVSGEASSGQLIARFAERTALFNEYGPTEASVCATVHRFKAGDDPRLIGRPINGCAISLRQTDGSSVPDGAEGEIWISGAGVAQGYLGDPDQTAARFVEIDGERHYRTGDWARQLPNGDLLFLGRRDGQIKLRGQRLELSEIRTRLDACPQIEGSHLRLLKQDDGPGRIAAYLLCRAGGTSPRDRVKAVRQQLAGQLPQFMVPTLWAVVDHWPLTTNGKISEKELPEAVPIGALPSEADHCEQHNFADEIATRRHHNILADVWQTLLGDRPSDKSDFFEAGGDSITALQFAARASEHGLKLKVADILKARDFAEIVAVCEPVAQAPLPSGPQSRPAEPEELPLLPMQAEFLEHCPEDRLHSFVQSMLLAPVKPLALPMLRNAIRQLVAGHEALNQRFMPGQSGWTAQTVWQDADEIDQHVARLRLPDLAAETLRAACEAQIRALDIRFGPLFKAVLLEHGSEQRLFLVFHHLIVDAVSWTAILRAFERAIEGTDADVPSESGYRGAVSSLAGRAEDVSIRQEIPVWQSLLERIGCLEPALHPDRTAVALKASLPAKLLETVQPSRRHGPGHLEILIAALARALRASGLRTGPLPVTIETHGRSRFAEPHAIAGEIGWFSGSFPAIVPDEPETGSATADTLAAKLAAEIDALPQSGDHFDTLRAAGHLDGSALDPGILVNFFGQFAPAGKSDRPRLLQPVDLPEPATIDLPPMRPRNLILTAGIDASGLTLQLLARKSFATRNQLQVLLDLMTTELESAAACRSETGSGDTPEAASWPATGTQQGMFYEEQLSPGSYAIRMALTFENVDRTALRAAFVALVRRHDSLRSCFRFDDADTLKQTVSPTVPLNWMQTDLRGQPEENQSREIEHLRQAEHRPLDLGGSPLHRFHEIVTGEGTCVLLWTLHHAIFDGWSLPVVLKDIAADHERHVRGEPSEQSPAPSYGSFADWLNGQDRETAIRHWRHRLQDFTVPTLLPPGRLDKRTETGEVAEFKSLDAVWDEDTSRLLADAARRARCTPATLLRAAWAMTLARFAGSRDVVFGSVVSGRPPERPDLQEAVGLFIATIPTRVRLPEEALVFDWLLEQQDDHFEDQGHAHLSAGEIQQLFPHLDGPAYRSIFAYENYPWDATGTGEPAEGLRLTGIESDERTNFDLALQAKLGRRLHLRLSYGEAIYDAASAEDILSCYTGFVQSLCREGTDRLSDKAIHVTHAQSVGGHRLVPTQATHGSALGHIRAFSRSTPGAAAIEDGPETLTYADLWSRSAQYAQRLAGAGLGPGDRIAIFAPRSADTLCAMVAIWRIGAAYVPLDRRLPEQRIAAMVARAGCRAIVHFGPEGAGLPDGTATIDLQQASGGDTGVFEDLPEPDSCAYVLFTSGSTGEPKGVEIPHGAIENYVRNVDYVSLGPGTRMAHLNSLIFDATTFEMWGALANGGTLIVFDDETAQDTQLFTERVLKDGVNTMLLTTALLDQYSRLAPKAIATLDQMLFGGEAPSPQLIERIFETGAPDRIIQVYGPTENTCFSTVDRIESVAATYPIGGFIKGTSGAVLSDEGLPVPPGQVGELHVCGQNLALGYANRPELTSQQFVSLQTETGPVRYYRTGDLVRSDRAGKLVYAGRRDRQVKVRGFRIEPDEIASAINACNVVSTSHVFTVGEGVACSLAAAVVLRERDSEEATLERLRQDLARTLPDFMVPVHFIPCADLPVTPGGKIDTQALKKTLASRETNQVNANLPRDGIELKLLSIWRDILTAPVASVYDDFFAIGGSSLSAIKVRHRIAEEFEASVSLADFLSLRTIEKIGGHIRTSLSGGASAETRKILPLKHGTGEFELVCVHPAGGTIFTYLPLGWELPEGLRVTGIQAFGVECDEEMPESLPDMAGRYLELLGDAGTPQVFLGASFGGLVAYEMARQACDRDEAASAILLDSQATDNPELLKTIRPVSMEVFREKLVKYNGMYPGISDAQIERYFNLYNRHLMMLASDSLAPSKARTTLLMATGDKSEGHREAMADYWRCRAPEFEVIEVPGDHSTILERPQLQTVIDLVLAERDRLVVPQPMDRTAS